MRRRLLPVRLLAARSLAALSLAALLAVPSLAGAQVAAQDLPAFIPPVTDADRAAAFPAVHTHGSRDQAINHFVLFDRAEWQTGNGQRALGVDAKGWIGRDISRLWLRAEGGREGTGGAGPASTQGEAHVLYGRAVARWWDVVAGVRQEVGPGPDRTWAAVGVQGLAPYWFEVEATAYVGASGRTQLRLQTEYELLVTNRLVLQPLAELQVNGKADPARGLAAGLSSAEAGLRLRYIVRREFAPYIGVTWRQQYFGTARLSRATGSSTGSTRLAVGARVWF